jgi:DNA topoisomerase-1
MPQPMSVSTDLLRADYWTRLPRRGQAGFAYRRPDGRPVRRPADLQRIARLAVPPAWTDVYISPDPEAELQAFGRDQAGRLQYRYHDDFMQRSAQQKWTRLAQFADVLPRLRSSTRPDLMQRGWTKDKVMALMTRLLHVAFFRVGSLRYTRRHRTHGLSTLHKRHVQVDGQRVQFTYRGKHGIVQVQQVRDPTLAKHLRGLQALPGRWLFQYQDASGQAHRVRATDLNAYLREKIGPFTAKDFRTWGGTLRAAQYLALAQAAPVGVSPRQVVVDMVKAVAQELGNTPAIARASYICPVIIDHFLAGEVIDELGDTLARRACDRGLTRSEAALRRLLCRGSAGLKKTRKAGKADARAEAGKRAGRRASQADPRPQ